MSRKSHSPRLRGFPPIARADATVLILGSMPSRVSLAAGEYYAHERNLFWPIMGRLLGFDPAAPYPERKRALLAARIALWDVLRSCVREGSLDADIRQEEVNDFAAFFRRHRRIRRVFFNGGMAAACYRRHVLPQVSGLGLDCRRLPSTSPAHASRPFADKLAAWRAALRGK